MGGIAEPINRFVDTMIESKAAFEKVKLEIDQKNAAVENCISNFRGDIAKVMSVGLETDDEDLAKLYAGIRSSLGQLLDAVANDIARTEKSTKFIKDHEQSFNVAVFGKVKAGKSYLGNFVMGTRIRQLDPASAYHKLPEPAVEVYDRGKVSTRQRLEEIEEDPNGFFVDANEATSAIQLFRLGALTWFDTPGIGSVTWENEMLAKDYVDNADLVIYTSNSDAAGTRQDFAEMKALYEKGKQFLLLLTQSDTLEEDWDDEVGDCVSILVPKSEKDRRDTEQYMRDTLTEQGMPRLRQDEILTISAKLALSALENGDEEKFQASNLGKFLEALTNITKTEGAQLKRETPIKRINTAIKEFLGRLEEAEKQLRQYQDGLKAKQQEMSVHGDVLLEQMKSQCRSRVDTLIRQKTLEVEKEKKSITAKELGEMLSNEVQGVLLRTCAGEFAASGESISAYARSLRMDGLGDLEMKKDTIHYEITVVRRVSRDPEGILEHIGAFFGKEYHTSQVSQEKRSSDVDIGVNEQQIMAIAHGQLEKLFETEVPGMMKKISEQYLGEVNNLLDAASRCIRSAKDEIGKLKCEL